MTPTPAEPTTGIRSKGDPRRWSVPPWDLSTNLHDVVGHFLRFRPYENASKSEWLAFHEAELKAIEQAPKGHMKYRLAWQWYGDLHYCIRRCIASTREALRKEAGSEPNNVRKLPAAQNILSTSSRGDLAS